MSARQSFLASSSVFPPRPQGRRVTDAQARLPLYGLPALLIQRILPFEVLISHKRTGLGQPNSLRDCIDKSYALLKRWIG